MKICCLMMQKNERTLLVPWVRYHAARFGIENLFVYDNGSDDEETIAGLSQLEKEGLNVSWAHNTKSDFVNKGNIIAEKIKSLDAEGGYDFYFPMDCDEFICVRKDNGVRIDKDSIQEELKNYINEDRVLDIDSMLFNNPVLPDEYMVFGPPNKCFFFNDTCKSLDIGFHQGKSKRGEGRKSTAIAYFHFHNRPYGDYLFHAKQKMKDRLENFGPDDAARYVSRGGAGSHLVSRMLKTRQEYEKQFADGRNDPFPVKQVVTVPEFRAHLEAIGAPIVWTVRNESMPLVIDNASRRSSAHDLFGWWIDSGPNWQALKGHVDAVVKDGDKIRFMGWACDRDGRPVPQLVVMADTDIVPAGELETIHRPDLGKAVPGVGPDCGFHLVVQTADIPTDTLELRVVAHDPRDRSTSIIKGTFGHAIQWADVGRNQWNLPAETSLGSRQLVRRWKETSPALAEERRTGLTRSDYLGLVRDGVRFFSQFQDGNGAIIDPYKGEEFQYSTPCFAFAAALVAHETDGEPSLVEKAALAMDWSCRALADRKAATNHEDFFPSPIAHAIPLLGDKVDTRRLLRWGADLAGFDPFSTYRRMVGGGSGPGSNWNCKALAGEYLLHKAGVRRSLGFVEASLAAQGRLFDNEFGMYAEGPMVYDVFPRAWLGDMVAAGYDGIAADALKEALDRGAAISLLLQSPNGELPCGGRSSHHIWADALQCVIFELAAAKAVKDEDLQLAGMYKRAARKALKAIRFWQRPSGEFWIVKNQSDPVLRHGYEGYSSHSQYNLLALTALGYAYQHAGETEFVQEQTTPPEEGHYIVDLPKPFNKVVACNAGTQVIVARQREGTQTPAGLLRVHFHNGVPQIGPSDGLLAETGYALPGTNRANLTIGLAWKSEAGWRSVADLADLSSAVTDRSADERETRFKLSYGIKDAPVSEVSESYTLSRDRVQIDYRISGKFDGLAVRVPIIVSDGNNEHEINVARNAVSVGIGSRKVTYSVDGANPVISADIYAHRNGFARIAEFELASSGNVRLIIDYSEEQS